jgi:hypothetical protein
MASQGNKVDKTAMRRRRLFNDFGWSAIAFASLLVIFCLASYQPQIEYKDLDLVRVFNGVLLTISIASILAGIWKATFRWKFLSVALAVAWLVPFILYFMSFAGPLFDIHFT